MVKFMKRLFKPIATLQKNLPSKDFALPIITITGTREIIIEQHYTLRSFTDNNIILQCEDGWIEMIGHSLFIKYMYPQTIILEGYIEEVKFHTSRDEPV